MTVAQPARTFDFGRNWQEYSASIDAEAIDAARQGLLGLIPEDRLRGSTFLDIGCGSGLHALAAARLGAQVTAIDVDPICVATTQALFAAQGVSADIRHMNALAMSALGQFDVVYSWGVLHHTGDLWRAIDCAVDRVAPGGVFAMALYERTLLCPLWQQVKRLYSKLPALARLPIEAAFGALTLAGYCMKRRQGPGAFLRSYRQNRGMSFWHDIDDWLGGYPYQPASSAAVVIRHLAPHGFHCVRVHRGTPKFGLFGAGCCQFLFHDGT